MSRLGRTMCQRHVIATVTASEFLISAHCLMILYIYTKICKNISNGFTVIGVLCYAEIADPVQTPQNAVSELGQHCLLTAKYMENIIKNENSHEEPLKLEMDWINKSTGKKMG